MQSQVTVTSCPNCGQKFPSHASYCPFCNRPARSGSFPTVAAAVVIVIFAALAFLVGYTRLPQGSATKPIQAHVEPFFNGPDSAFIATDFAKGQYWPLRIHDVNATTGRPFGTITGKVTNEGKENFRLVSIVFTIRDSEGNKIGSTPALCSGLDSGDTWKFDAIVAESGDYTYELSDVQFR